VLAWFAFGGKSRNAKHRAGDNEETIFEMSAPDLSPAGRKLLAGFAYAEQGVAWEKRIDDFFGVTLSIIETNRRLFPKVVKPRTVFSERVNPAVIGLGPFRLEMC